MAQTAPCCPAMDTQWTQRVVDKQSADVYCCVSCGHVHRIEKYMLPMRFPGEGRCVNCGTDLKPSGREMACPNCSKTVRECQDYHNKLAALHPSRRFLTAAHALHAAGRHVLALKLATAEVVWGDEPVEGMLLRLQVLESVDQMDRALDEAYEWSERPGAPIALFGTIAQLEASTGNLPGAISALERGLNKAPERADWWCDLAEISAHQDDRPFALRAAGKGLHDPQYRPRCLHIIAEVGERYYASKMYAEALSACSLAQKHQEEYFDIAWLRARIAGSQNDQNYLIKWLETALKIDPNHAEAQAMLEPYKKKQTNWFGWAKR